jgi:hypothetical protein
MRNKTRDPQTRTMYSFQRFFVIAEKQDPGFFVASIHTVINAEYSGLRG